MLKSAREIGHITYRGTKVRIISDFLLEMMQARK